MNASIYVSRNFVEFGPFTESEVRQFHERGIQRDPDHIRRDGARDRMPLDIWWAGHSRSIGSQPTLTQRSQELTGKLKTAEKPPKGSAKSASRTKSGRSSQGMTAAGS